MSRVLIADDHPILRRGLREILERGVSGVVCGEAGNAVEVREQLDHAAWDLLILDVSMPGQSGIEVLNTVKSLRPKLPVLILSMHGEDQYARRLLRAGASGYLTKGSAPEELIIAVRRILAGALYVSAALAERLALDLSDGDGRPPHESLSDREFEVMRQLASGKTASQIAADLNLSVATVSTYRARVLEKMNMTSTAQLIRYAVTAHLVD